MESLLRLCFPWLMDSSKNQRLIGCFDDAIGDFEDEVVGLLT